MGGREATPKSQQGEGGIDTEISRNVSWGRGEVRKNVRRGYFSQKNVGWGDPSQFLEKNVMWGPKLTK